ncbi:hypothetical protein PFISCL1PPCAC_9639, partial [Pristionchus fissidentatus]
IQTFLANGQIASRERMAADNGCTWTLGQVTEEFEQLHEKREWRRKSMEENGEWFGFKSQQYYDMKAERDNVGAEILELSEWWNHQLNPDVVDVHHLMKYQAPKMVASRIKSFQNFLSTRGTIATSRMLVVITGKGKSVIKESVVQLLEQEQYNNLEWEDHNKGCNEGCIIINF